MVNVPFFTTITMLALIECNMGGDKWEGGVGRGSGGMSSGRGANGEEGGLMDMEGEGVRE